MQYIFVQCVLFSKMGVALSVLYILMNTAAVSSVYTVKYKICTVAVYSVAVYST